MIHRDSSVLFEVWSRLIIVAISMSWLMRQTWRRARLILLCLCWTALADGQTAKPGPSPSPYLLRLAWAKPVQWSCILVQAGGQYHQEFVSAGKSGFSDGKLSANGLTELTQILSSDRLLHLEQKDIHSPFLEDGTDLLRLVIFRPGSGRQDLLFPSPEFAFPGTVGPVLRWLDRMQKRKGSKLSEDAGRNSCAIPGEKEIRLTNRPDSGGKPANR